MDEVTTFLKNHPSLFIMASTVIIIIIIFVYFTERKSKEHQVQCVAFELQEIPARPDETDTAQVRGLPLSSLANRGRYDRLNNEPLYGNYQPRPAELAPVHEEYVEPAGVAVPLEEESVKYRDNKPRNFNRASVSDLHKRSEYTSFGDFDDFDVLNPNGYNQNVMRITVDFNAKDQNYVTSQSK